MLIIEKKRKPIAPMRFWWYFGISLHLPVKDMDDTLELSEMENENEDDNLIETLSFADLLRKLLSIPEVGSLNMANY